MSTSSTANGWSLESAISILRSRAQDVDTTLVELPAADSPPSPPSLELDPSLGRLGDFSAVWHHLGLSAHSEGPTKALEVVNINLPQEPSPSIEFSQLVKGVKWRDEYDGADLEDNVEPQQVTAANLRTRKRAARRARARERELEEEQGAKGADSDSTTDDNSGEELENLRRSPDRRALIANLLGRPRPVDITPPTSPSPPKENSILRTPSRKEWPVSQPFLWSTPTPKGASAGYKSTITPVDGLTPRARKTHLVKHLARCFPDEERYLKNSGLLEPAFSPLNTSPIGIHVFIDVSNISIGFHDCLKMTRGIPIASRVRRIPMSFHNLSLVLERGRPAAKRILSGSDRSPMIDQAEACGYETNILDRVHKAKTPTKPRKNTPSKQGGGYNSMSYGETSGSETPGYLASTPTYKWSEQAVDEILHLKMSHSILDSDKPSTIVLATGDAAEAEYSDGFLKMVERALNKGWMVELVSFKMNTSSLYRRQEFRNKWGRQFKWIQLDDFVESLFDVENDV